MATSNSERRSRAMLGELPADFLRVGGSDPQQQQLQNDAAMAQQLQASQAMFPASTMARLNITITQAKLTKNYSLVKMDPYCRIRIGNSVFETPTAHSGGKNPRWMKTIQCFIPKGVDSIYLEIFDERAFSMDDKVAWAHIQIPAVVFRGQQPHDEWFSLNGKQGDGKEGMVNLIMDYTEHVAAPMVQQPTVYTTGAAPIMMIPAGMPAYYPPTATVVTTQQQQPQPYIVPQQPYPPQQQQQQQQQAPGQHPAPAQARPQGPAYTAADVADLRDMFPAVDEEVIKSLLEVNAGNKDTTINNLLAMSAS